MFNYEVCELRSVIQNIGGLVAFGSELGRAGRNTLRIFVLNRAGKTCLLRAKPATQNLTERCSSSTTHIPKPCLTLTLEVYAKRFRVPRCKQSSQGAPQPISHAEVRSTVQVSNELIELGSADPAA